VQVRHKVSVRGASALAVALSLSVGLMITSATAGAAEDKPLNPRVTVKVPDIQAASEGGLYTAMERGYFAKQGIDIQLVPVTNSADQIALLATGDLSVGVGAPTPTFFNAAANGIDLKFACTWVEQGKGDGALGLYVRKPLIDSGQVKSVADLKGKTVALASASEPFQLTKALDSAKLKVSDVNAVGLAYPDMVTAFANGSIDAALILEPFGISAETRGFASRLAPAGDFYVGPATFVTAGPAFARSHPEAMTRFLEAFMKGQREYQEAFYGDGKDKAAIVDILVKNTRIKDPAIYAAVEAKQGLPRIEPNCALPNAKAINEIQDVFVKAGLQPKRIKVSSVLEDKYAKAALKKIGTADTSVTKPASSATTTPAS